MATIDQDPVSMDPEDLQRSAIASIGEHWGVLLFLGIVSLLVGFFALLRPVYAVAALAILLAIWLIISGLFQIVRGFSHGLTGGMRALLFIGGALSLILGVFALSGAFQAAEILAIFIGIAFLFRGFGSLFMAAEQKDGRGWNIFGGIIMLIGGFVVLLWPGISLVTLAWVTGIWLIVGGIFEVIAAFRLRGLAKKAVAA